MSAYQRIDVHHHFVPPVYKQISSTSKEWPTPDWDVEIDTAFNKKLGISTAILSLTTPGPELAKSLEEARHVARDANDTAASIRDANPDHYGFFAAIPSPANDLENALAEVTYAYNELQSDGITLFSSYDGKYLGHPDFDPLWEALNRRKAIVFMHPTSPKTWSSFNPAMLPPVLDFAFETTKTAIDMILRGTLRRFPDVKVILSHAGGTLPFIWERPALLLEPMGLSDVPYATFKDDATKFYYDTALSGNPQVIELLTKFAKPGHVFYGSDFPYAAEDVGRAFTERFDSAQISEEIRRSVNREGALQLFPRFRRA